VVSARDCAGNNAPAKTINFTIDLTAATIVSIDPANASTIGATRAVTGTLSAADVRSVVVSGTSLAATVNGTSFTFANLPLGEGANAFAFVVTDNAGNVSTYNYAVTLKSSAPVVEIVEGGVAIPQNAVFTRSVAPVVRVSDPNATVTAKLNGNAFTNGTVVSATARTPCSPPPLTTPATAPTRRPPSPSTRRRRWSRLPRRRTAPASAPRA